MKLKPCARFSANFRNDQVEDETGVIELGGRAAAQAVARILGKHFWVSALKYKKDLGWGFSVKIGKKKARIYITGLNKSYRLYFDKNALKPSIFEMMFGYKFHHHVASFLFEAEDLIARDRRFRDIRWYSHDELDGGGPGCELPYVVDKSPSQPSRPQPAAVKSKPDAGGMQFRPWAEFEADFPSDQIEEDGEIVQFGGGNVARAIAEILTRLGYKPEEPEHAGEHGWQFCVPVEGLNLYAQITELDGYLFNLDELGLFRGKSWKPKAQHVEAILKLNDALHQDPRFHDILWYSPDDLQTGVMGTKSPVVQDS